MTTTTNLSCSSESSRDHQHHRLLLASCFICYSPLDRRLGNRVCVRGADYEIEIRGTDLVNFSYKDWRNQMFHLLGGRVSRGPSTLKVLRLLEWFKNRMREQGMVCITWGHHVVGEFLTHTGWTLMVEVVKNDLRHHSPGRSRILRTLTDEAMTSIPIHCK